MPTFSVFADGYAPATVDPVTYPLGRKHSWSSRVKHSDRESTAIPAPRELDYLRHSVVVDCNGSQTRFPVRVHSSSGSEIRPSDGRVEFILGREMVNDLVYMCANAKSCGPSVLARAPLLEPRSGERDGEKGSLWRLIRWETEEITGEGCTVLIATAAASRYK